MAQRALAMGHGLFFLISGLWPVFDIRSFEKVTGPKEDDWLVKTVGLLIAVSGGVMFFSSTRSKEIPKEVRVLAAGNSIVLGGVSLYYSLKGRIAKIYLLDAAVESALAGAWLATGADEANKSANKSDEERQTAFPPQGSITIAPSIH